MTVDSQNCSESAHTFYKNQREKDYYCDISFYVSYSVFVCNSIALGRYYHLSFNLVYIVGQLDVATHT